MSKLPAGPAYIRSRKVRKGTPRRLWGIPAVTISALGSTCLIALAVASGEHGQQGRVAAANRRAGSARSRLPGAPGSLGSRVTVPEAAARAVAASQQGGELAQVRVSPRWVGAAQASLGRGRGAERGQVEQNRQPAEPVPGEVRDPAVVGRQGVAPWGALDPGPVHSLRTSPPPIAAIRRSWRSL